MRRISKSTTPPKWLLSDRVESERERILEYLRRPALEREQRRDELNERLIFNDTFHDELARAFFRKCAFCESQLDDGTIVHFRPLRFASNSRREGGDISRDYYLWLAFEWRNIFYACHDCARAKRDIFPVEGLRAPFLSSFEDCVRQERPLLIDPSQEDPSRHLQLLSDGRLHATTTRGATTIDAFHLNRHSLIVQRLSEIRNLFAPIKGRNTEYSRHQLGRPGAPYSGLLLKYAKRVANMWPASGIQTSLGTRAFIADFEGVLSGLTKNQADTLTALLKALEASDEKKSDDFEPYAVQHSLAAIDKEKLYADDWSDISEFTIRNFKAINTLAASFPEVSSSSYHSGAPCLMLLGENSTGKSSILSAIALALIGTRHARQYKNYLPALVSSLNDGRFDQLDGRPIAIELASNTNTKAATLYYDPRSRVIEGTRDPACLVLGYGPRRFFDPRKQPRKGNVFSQIQTLFDPGATIPYPSDWLRRQTGSKFNNIAAALRIVLSLDDKDEIIVKPDHLAVRANGRVTAIDALSEGYRSVFAMTVDMMRSFLEHWDDLERASGVVLIDEIETHLHPRWKMRVMTSLRKVLPRVQFIASTHDPLCLRGMDDDEVMLLRRNEHNEIEVVQDLPSVRGMTAEQLLLSDYFGLSSTADPAMELDLAQMAGDFVKRSGDGSASVTLSQGTVETISELTIGDSSSEALIQEAIKRYLSERELRRRKPVELREEAVRAIVDILSGRASADA